MAKNWCSRDGDQTKIRKDKFLQLIRYLAHYLKKYPLLDFPLFSQKIPHLIFYYFSNSVPLFDRGGRGGGHYANVHCFQHTETIRFLLQSKSIDRSLYDGSISR